MALDETRIPVVIAAGQSVDRDPTAVALDLAVRAAEEAFDEAPSLRGRVQLVSMVNVMSNAGPADAATAPAPAAAVARALGLKPTRTEVSTIGGNSPQWLISRAASAIAAGELEVALVVGAEAQHSAKAQASGAAPRPEPTPADDKAPAHNNTPDTTPDPVVGNDRVGIGEAEMRVGLLAPVHVYALFESAMAHRAGRSGAEQRKVLGELMAPFTAVAATQPVAWFRAVRTPEELSTVTTDNRLVAEPYPKRMCAFLHVNQGAAVLVTSLAAARAAGVADMAVFCWSGAEANEVWFPTARPDLSSSAGLHAATTGALSTAGLGVDDIGVFDLYSCFPCAVEMGVDALGIAPDDTRGLTTTGGLPYFGGPGNNYSLHGVASTVYRIRAQGGTGLVSAMGWYATKHAVGIYGATLPPRGWRRGDTDAAQRVIDASALPVATEAESPAEVVAATMVVGRDGTVTAAPVIAELPDRRRIAAAADPDELPGLAGRALVGHRIEISGNPPRYRLST